MAMALLGAAHAAWAGLAQVNFFYPVWHDIIGIDQTIEIYAPKNRYRHGFEQTSKAERSRLFAAIVDAIHNQGRGLRALVYHDISGRPLDHLLREPEIVHLQDVANLVDRLKPVGPLAAIVLGTQLIALRSQRLPMPSIMSLLLSAIASLGALAGAILILGGPVKVFYWLHTLIFPAGHQWFFYYQDSLMSTMMKAPDLFGYLAMVWAIATLLLLLTFVGFARRVINRV